MKLVKMSLVAALLVGSSAFAIENVKVDGDAKVYYGTDDSGSGDLFSKDNSYADTALRIGVTADLMEGVSVGLTGYAVSTLGLENNLVSNTWSAAHGADLGTGNGFLLNAAGGAQVNDASWIGEAWVAGTLGKTTVKVGRMELDTPLAFSESWSITPNTFEGAVLLNQDIPDTTLVAAWVGKGNGYNAVQTPANAGLVGIDYMGADGDFTTYAHEGAYAVAIVNNSWKPLTAQAWYYNVLDVANAYWLQADMVLEQVAGLTLGAQYAAIDTQGRHAGADDSSGFAVKAGLTKEMFAVSAAYSQTDEDGVLKLANTATNNLGGAQSKLYTEAWWNYGYVGRPDTSAYNLTGTTSVEGIADFGLYFTSASDDRNDVDMTEVTLEAAKSFGPIDAGLYYIYTDADDQNIVDGEAESYGTVQVYLTYNF